LCSQTTVLERHCRRTKVLPRCHTVGVLRHRILPLLHLYQDHLRCPNMVVRSKACPISVLLSKVQLTQGELIQIQLNSKVQLIQALQI
jgi:hypothetical protein